MLTNQYRKPLVIFTVFPDIIIIIIPALPRLFK